MTGIRPHTRSTYLRLKAAARDLVDKCGGLERAAAHTRINKTRLAAAGSPTGEHEAAFLAADVIADLEQAAGDPVITRELARISGYELFHLPAPHGVENWVSLLGGVSGGAGDVIARLADALKDDGEVTSREVRRLKLIDLTDDALSVLVRLRAALNAAMDEGER